MDNDAKNPIEKRMEARFETSILNNPVVVTAEHGYISITVTEKFATWLSTKRSKVYLSLTQNDWENLKEAVSSVTEGELGS